MAKQTMGEMIAALRREKGMTQRELAEQMNVTDKAVSKWERDLSCPDINSIPKLAQILGVSVEELMDVPTRGEKTEESKKTAVTVLTALALAMGVGVVLLLLMEQLTMDAGFAMLALGVAGAGLAGTLKRGDTVSRVLSGIAAAAGMAVAILGAVLDVPHITGFVLLGLGLGCVGVAMLREKQE